MDLVGHVPKDWHQGKGRAGCCPGSLSQTPRSPVRGRLGCWSSPVLLHLLLIPPHFSLDKLNLCPPAQGPRTLPHTYMGAYVHMWVPLHACLQRSWG